MAVTPVTALSETCLGVTTRLPPPGTTCTPVPPVSALCASLRAKAVIAEYTLYSVRCRGNMQDMQLSYAQASLATRAKCTLGISCYNASTLSSSLLVPPCLLNLPSHLDQIA